MSDQGPKRVSLEVQLSGEIDMMRHAALPNSICADGFQATVMEV